MSLEATQRNAHNNQSTVDFEVKNPFIWGNRYEAATFLNNTGADLDVESGILVIRDTANAGQVIPLPSGVAANYANLVGVLRFDNKTTIANGATVKADFCHKGDLDSGLLSFADDVAINFDATVGTKAFRDIFNDLGLILKDVTELSNTDN